MTNQLNHIGKKVTVYFGFEKKVERVLKEDHAGLYIDYKNKRVPVRPKPHDNPVLKNYLAHPKFL